jgi:hypothetical protein
MLIAFSIEARGTNSEEGLLARWKFDEGSSSTAKDSSGNGNDGTIYGAVWTSGKIGHALSFDGLNDWVDIPDDISPEHITLAAWIYPTGFDDAPGDQGNPIITKETGRGTPPWSESFAWRLRITPRSHHLQLQVFTDTGGASAVSTTVLQVRTWYHVAGTYDGITAKLYVDGTLEDLNVSSDLGPLVTTSLPTAIGHLEGWSVQWFEGIIDEVRVYNRALSSSEIEALLAIPKTVFEFYRDAAGANAEMCRAWKEAYIEIYNDDRIGGNYVRDAFRTAIEAVNTVVGMIPSVFVPAFGVASSFADIGDFAKNHLLASLPPTSMDLTYGLAASGSVHTIVYYLDQELIPLFDQEYEKWNSALENPMNYSAESILDTLHREKKWLRQLYEDPLASLASNPEIEGELRSFVNDTRDGIDRTRTYVEKLIAELGGSGTMSEPEPVDDFITLAVGQAGYDRRTRRFGATVTVMNTSQKIIGNPLWLVIESISEPEVSLANADGMTAGSEGYIDASKLVDDGRLDPGESITTRIYFNNPNRKRFRFELSVRSGMIEG